MRQIKYLKYVLKHKWYVFVAACKLGIPLLGIVHDLSKFRRDEWFAYAAFFYSDKTEEKRAAFDIAWLKHLHRNKHHWQWWILQNDSDGEKILPMPDRYRKEMLADWIGAGKAITGKDNTAEWYIVNAAKMKLHPETREWIENQVLMPHPMID